MDQTDYPALFGDYLGRSLDYVLAAVRATATLLPDDLREQALHTLRFALDLTPAWLLTRDLLLVMAPKMEQAGFRDEWLPYLEAGLRQSQRIGDGRAEAELTLEIGYVFQLRGKLSLARTHYTASASIFEKVGATHRQALSVNRQAFIAWLQRRYEEIPGLIELASKLLPEDDPERATSYVVLGWVALDRRDWQTGVAYFAQALQLWQKRGDKREIARRLRDLASALQMQQQYAESIVHYQRAIDLFDEVEDIFEQAVAKMNLGVVYLSVGQMHEAATLFALAEPIFRRVQDVEHLAMLYNNQGIVYRNLGRWASAKHAFLTKVKSN